MENIQLEWDRCLVQGFFKHQDTNMGHLCGHFVLCHGLTWNQFNALKRVPTFPHHNKITICRFICGYLPKIGNYLWGRTWNDRDKCLATINKSNITTKKEDAKAQIERAEVNKANKDFKNNVSLYGLRLQNNEKNSRRAWSVCK